MIIYVNKYYVFKRIKALKDREYDLLQLLFILQKY